MSWSLGEARALAVKAARGAGMPWGLAEEAGFAVYRLQQYGLPGARALVEYLTLRSSSSFESLPVWENTIESGAYCPIEKGVAIQDLPDSAEENIGHVFYPLLLLPFLPPNRVLEYSGNRVSNSSIAIVSGTDSERLLCKKADCSWKNSSDQVSVDALETRVPDSEHAYIDWLGEFAAKTYAPATEQSRLAGAGAGLSDND